MKLFACLVGLLFFTVPAFAAGSIFFSGAPGVINYDQEIELEVALDCGNCGDSYLRGVFADTLESTNYFGATQNNFGNWIGTSNDKTQYFKVAKEELVEGSWSGKLKVRPDRVDAASAGYYLKVGRYTSSGSSATWSDKAQIQISGPSPTPTVTPSLSPTLPDPTATSMPTPTLKPIITSSPTSTPARVPTQTPTPTKSPTPTPIASTSTKSPTIGPTAASILPTTVDKFASFSALEVLGVTAMVTPDRPHAVAAVGQASGSSRILTISLAFVSAGVGLLALVATWYSWRKQNAIHQKDKLP